jgi:hypothetical protein
MNSDNPSQPDPIPYAEPSLPTGGVVYRQLEYPSDRAGFWNPARFADDGTTMRLEPGPLRLRLIAVCSAVACFMGVMFVTERSRTDSANLTKLAFQVSVWGLLGVLLFIAPGLCALWRRQRTPWISVDRSRKAINLPRARTVIPWTRVVRLQLVSFARVGWSARTLSYHGEPYSGEVQIVFHDGPRDQTWCIVAWPAKDVFKRFAVAFHQATEIPVSRITHHVSGEWVVEAFDENADKV